MRAPKSSTLFMGKSSMRVNPCFDDIDASLDDFTKVIVDGKQQFLSYKYDSTDDPDEAINIYDFQSPFD